VALALRARQYHASASTGASIEKPAAMVTAAINFVIIRLLSSWLADIHLKHCARQTKKCADDDPVPGGPNKLCQSRR
jgi:hypothetical protein